ncbi:MAG TPA: hypothetical protein O0X27_06660 [Methanocorpusculum sp.]|nr:hypothetical protein [Methanocorpusculum sp.]
MIGKRFVMAGVLAVVLTCCIVAAGCTGTSSVPATETPAKSIDVAGIWGGTDPSGTHGYFVFYENGTGARYIEAGSDYQIDAYVWETTDSGYDLVFGSGGLKMRVPLQLDAEQDALMDSSGLLLTKQTKIPALQ